LVGRKEGRGEDFFGVGRGGEEEGNKGEGEIKGRKKRRK